MEHKTESCWSLSPKQLYSVFQSAKQFLINDHYTMDNDGQLQDSA